MKVSLYSTLFTSSVRASALRSVNISLIFTLMHFKILYYTSVFLINFLCNENTASFANVRSLSERPSLFRTHIKRVCDFCQKKKLCFY